MPGTNKSGSKCYGIGIGLWLHGSVLPSMQLNMKSLEEII